MWLGPPSMNSHTTRLARGAKCGGRAASGLTGSSSGSLPFADRAISAASAREPKPPPARARKSRRDVGTSTEQGRIGEPEDISKFKELNRSKRREQSRQSNKRKRRKQRGRQRISSFPSVHDFF